jgi:hypothetical protein
MVEIPTEVVLYVVLAFMSAFTALLLKNTWDTVKIRGCIKRIEGRLGIAQEAVEDNTKKLEKLGGDVRELQTKDSIYHNSPVKAPV